MVCKRPIRQSANQKGDAKGTILGDPQKHELCWQPSEPTPKV